MNSLELCGHWPEDVRLSGDGRKPCCGFGLSWQSGGSAPRILHRRSGGPSQGHLSVEHGQPVGLGSYGHVISWSLSGLSSIFRSN